MLFYLLLSFMNGIVFGAFCGWIAKEKGRDIGAWVVFGIAFGIFALLVLAILPKANLNDLVVTTSTAPPIKSLHSNDVILPESKNCPRCAESIKFMAIVCHYCHYDFGEQTVTSAREEYVRQQKEKVERKRLAQEKLTSRREHEIRERFLADDLNSPDKLMVLMDPTIQSTTRARDVTYLERLIDSGADIHFRSRFLRYRPLHIAARYRTLEIVDLLLRKGADMNARDFLGRTPLDHAIKYNRPEITEYLIDEGAKTGASLKGSQLA